MVGFKTQLSGKERIETFSAERNQCLTKNIDHTNDNRIGIGYYQTLEGVTKKPSFYLTRPKNCFHYTMINYWNERVRRICLTLSFYRVFNSPLSFVKWNVKSRNIKVIPQIHSCYKDSFSLNFFIRINFFFNSTRSWTFFAQFQVCDWTQGFWNNAKNSYCLIS